jgi:hypothetical protein
MATSIHSILRSFGSAMRPRIAFSASRTRSALAQKASARALAARTAALLYAERHLHHYRGNAASKTALQLGRQVRRVPGHDYDLSANYQLLLQAWAFFPNHYHLVLSFSHSDVTHRDLIKHLHRELALRLNKIDNSPGRPVMYEFWDTGLT